MNLIHTPSMRGSPGELGSPGEAWDLPVPQFPHDMAGPAARSGVAGETLSTPGGETALMQGAQGVSSGTQVLQVPPKLSWGPSSSGPVPSPAPSPRPPHLASSGDFTRPRTGASGSAAPRTRQQSITLPFQPRRPASCRAPAGSGGTTELAASRPANTRARGKLSSRAAPRPPSAQGTPGPPTLPVPPPQGWWPKLQTHLPTLSPPVASRLRHPWLELGQEGRRAKPGPRAQRG